jgi:transposase
MSAYSQDLRQRVIDTVERGEGSLRQIARRFLVSLSFVTRLLRHHRETGSVEPKPHRGGRPPALGPADLERLRQLNREQPDATLEELRQRLGVDCSLMAISRALRKLKITRKKKDLHAQERDRPEVKRKRRAFRKQVAGIDPKRLVFVDESGANTAMTRTSGRAPAGERVHGSAPGHWDMVTLICGLRLSGVTAPVVVPGATDTAVFESYVEQVLVPQLQAGDVVIWDNLKPHKANAVVSAVEDAGAQLIPLPPWSSDMTPIEEMFSKVKGSLRSVAARTTETVTAAIGLALHEISAQDILACFRHHQVATPGGPTG